MLHVHYINKEPTKVDNELEVNYYPKHQCPLNVTGVNLNGVDYGKPCRSDCMFFGTRGTMDIPICFFLEASKKAWTGR